MPAGPAAAQRPDGVRIGAQVTPTYIRASPVPGGGTLDEARLLHPVLMLHAAGLGGRLAAAVTLNFEGATLEDGELAPGAWGEGFVDRRHPHTYLHEAVLTADDLLGRLDGGSRLSLTAGKGFVPFGTDDPMSRPPVRYPVNHHLAQILERAVAIAAVRTGPVALEAGLFNGDEPERPGQLPLVRHDGRWRFGDSWAARLTLWPAGGIEAQGSYARVHSPEHRPGQGTDQEKWSASLRLRREVRGAPVYALLEWARTAEADGFFVYRSLLGESAWNPGRHRLLYRFERTERPEEERTSPFRSHRPHLENSILGVTRWTTHTLGYSLDLGGEGDGLIRPFVEVTHGRIGKVGDGLFDIEVAYGKDSFTAIAVGARLGIGHGMQRMGRYGAAANVPDDSATHPH